MLKATGVPDESAITAVAYETRRACSAKCSQLRAPIVTPCSAGAIIMLPVADSATEFKEAEMVRELTLRQIGGSIGATIPKDMADRLHLEAGDRVLAIETPDGILLTPYDPNVEKGLAIAANAAKKYRNALRELAK